MDDHNLAIQRIHKTLSDKDAKTIPVCRYSLRLGMFDGELIRVLNRTRLFCIAFVVETGCSHVYLVR